MSFVALLLLAGCTRTPPEAALREAVAELQAAIDARDASALASGLDEDFIGPGGMDRDGARRMAALYFLRHSRVALVTGPLSVGIEGDRAEVSLTAAVSGGGGRLLPDTGQVYAVRSGWRLRGGDWRMTSIEWTPALR